jgi:hypothetical protein
MASLPYTQLTDDGVIMKEFRGEAPPPAAALTITEPFGPPGFSAARAAYPISAGTHAASRHAGRAFLHLLMFFSR